MALKNLEVKFTADTTGLQQGFKEAQSGLSSLGSKISSFVKTGLALAGITASLAAIVGGMKKAESAFVSLNSSMMRTSDIFGDANKYIQYFAESTGKSFGLAETSAYQYAAVYGNLFRSITSSSQENAKVTIAMMKASAVIASKTGRTMEDVMERIRSGLLGNTEAIEDLGVNVGVAALEATDAFKQIANGRSWEQLSFYEQQQIRTLGILEQAHKNFGDSVQRGPAYSLALLSSSFKDLTAYAGAFVNAGLQPVIAGLTQLVQWATAGLKALAALMGVKVQTNATDAAGVGAIKSQTTAQDGLTDATNKTAKATEKAAKARQKLAGFDEINTVSNNDTGTSGAGGGAGAGTDGGAGVFSGIPMPEYSPEIGEPDTSWVSGVQKKFQGLADFFSVKFAPSIAAWGKAFNSLRKPAADAFASVQASASNLWNNTLAPFGDYIVGKWIPDIVNGFSETFAPIFSDVMTVAFSEFALNFQFACQQIDNFVHDILQPSMEFMRGAALDVFDGIKQGWDAHGAAILQGFQGFTASLREIWTSLYDNIFKPVFESIGGTIQWLWDNHLKPLWDNITDFVGEFIADMFQIWNQTLAPLIQWIIATFGPSIANTFKFIGDVLGTVFGVISDVFGGFIRILKGVVEFITGVLTGDWSKAWDGLKDIVGGSFDAMLGVVKGVVNLIVDVLNHMIRGINHIQFNVPDWVPVLGGDHVGLNVPLIPKLAKGGVITGPTVAQLGEDGHQEAVVPLERNTGWAQQVAELINAASGMGGDINLTVTSVLDSGEIVAVTKKKIRRETRNINQPVLA